MSCWERKIGKTIVHIDLRSRLTYLRSAVSPLQGSPAPHPITDIRPRLELRLILPFVNVGRTTHTQPSGIPCRRVSGRHFPHHPAAPIDCWSWVSSATGVQEADETPQLCQSIRPVVALHPQMGRAPTVATHCPMLPPSLAGLRPRNPCGPPPHQSIVFGLIHVCFVINEGVDAGDVPVQ